MTLTPQKLLYLWNMRENIFAEKSNEYLVKRYDQLVSIFEKISKMDVRITESEVIIDGNLLTFNDGGEPSREYFACAEDDLTAPEAFKGIEIMCQCLPNTYSGIIKEIGCILGGFDFKTHKMKEYFRIISNTVTAKNDNGSLTSNGQIRHPSSHFADNNYFFNVIDTIHKIKDGTFDINTSRLALRWPTEAYYGTVYPSKNATDEEIKKAEKNKANAIKEQRETLRFRFPYKFFYMWTHADECIHLTSLMAYKNLVSQDDHTIEYKRDRYQNEDYLNFSSDNGWKMYSSAIMKIIPEDKRGDNFISDLSKLLSIVLCQDQDTKSMKDLLDTGNKAIILCGPPGTGKTYSAKHLVCEELGIPGDKLQDYVFNADSIQDEGCWSIVQFHPNYTYEDFIGGISPELNGSNLAYTLKEGIFKKLCDTANRPENKDKKFILIVDEINRADLSSVFGELMYALEYRGEKIRIPNFEKEFVIPKNVYLIGTMNSIDKSLVTFDIALRRRFGFFKIMPKVNVLPSMLADHDLQEDNINAFVARCETLNNKIASDDRLQLGKDYQIGHAYFGKIADFLNGNTEITSFEMEKLWLYHIEPLLQEYLGNRVDDPETKKIISELKDFFIAPF